MIAIAFGAYDRKNVSIRKLCEIDAITSIQEKLASHIIQRVWAPVIFWIPGPHPV